MQFLSLTNVLLWQWLLPFLLVLTAVLWAIRLCGRPIRGFSRVLRNTYGSLLSRGDSADKRRQHRIFASALAAMMGTGNLVGTAYALISGGAGAIFWMWVSALLGMVLVYAENLLGSRWRQGTLGVLRYGVGSRVLAAIFAVCCTGAALGMGNLMQTSAIAQTARGYGIPQPLAGVVTALLLGIILCGGLQRVHRAAGVLMPLLCGLYFAGCGILLVHHAAALPDAFAQIIRGAFGLRAAGSGISAALLLRSMRVGIQRGIFSNEAGLGSSAMLHRDAAHDRETAQSEWAAAEVFADTVLCCTATVLVILTAQIDIAAYTDGAALLLAAFSSGLGRFASGFLAICMVLLAFATMVGWYPCGLAAVQWLTGDRGTFVYLCAYLLAAFAGSLGDPAWLWALCDLCNGCMALPNLYALLYFGIQKPPHRAD